MDFVTTMIKISLKKLPVEGKAFFWPGTHGKNIAYNIHPILYYRPYFLNKYFRYVYRFVCDLQELVGCSADQLHRMLDIQPDTDEK